MIFIFFADRDPDGWEDEEPEGKLADMAKVRSELAAGICGWCTWADAPPQSLVLSA